MKTTLDFNCVIDLENKESLNSNLYSIIQLQEKGNIELAIPGISASERFKAGQKISNFSEFQKRIQKLSVREIEILKPMGIWNFTFYGWCIWGGIEMENLDRAIHETLFPNIPFIWREYAQKNDLDPENQEVKGKWRNARCDSISLWCHIYYQREIFITRDNNFLKTKKERLIKLGAKSICTPDEALVTLNSVLEARASCDSLTPEEITIVDAS